MRGLHVALPAVVMILARTAIHGMDGFGHSLEPLISSLSNSLSYGRILALALTHGAFARILSFIQTLRLHWVEWFLKFYSGDGYEYRPLRFG